MGGVMFDPASMSVEEWLAGRAGADTREWVRVSAEAGEWLGRWTGRDDVLVTVEPGGAGGAAAVFVPESASIRVDPVVCASGVDPADVRLGSARGRLAHAALAGAARHEAGHAAFSLWPIDQSPGARAVMEAALLLEEPVMERDVVRSDPGARVLLRASFHGIVNASAGPLGGAAGAARVACLTHGRVDAGVLDMDEVAEVVEACTGVLGADRYARLREVWLEVMALPVPRADAGVMAGFGRRWLDILGADAPRPGAGGVSVPVCGVPAGDGDGDGDGDAVAVAVAVAAAAVSDAAAGEAAAAGDALDAAEAAGAAAAAAARAAADAAAAGDVFGRPGGTGSGGDGGEGLSGVRPVTGAERGWANVLAEELAEAQYRDRSVVVVGSRVPPGRLRGRDAMRRDAERALGLPPSAEPFRRRVRRAVPQPPLTVGIGCDISGSMGWAAGSVASVAWVVADAVHQIDGDSATVAFGNRVHAVVGPGEVPGGVRLFDATGGSEDFVGAASALNGALRLEHGPGARLAVFISDGHYTARQRSRGQVLVDRWVGAGVRVLWIGHLGPDRDRPFDGVRYVRVTGASDVGRVVGGAMVDLLREV